ncbi:MAG TPA: hypothetical protein VM370_00475 [Candidatus Thermoplasmatota archaeon]|nr:hypothetical protein [Candidatus Thermoplasmatota archaeon]
MEPRIVLFCLRADPHPVERLGAFLPDGCLVDLQTAHMSMRGRPAPLFRDRTSFRLASEDARRLAREVLAWVDSQRAPGTALDPKLARIVDEHPDAGAPPVGNRGPP